MSALEGIADELGEAEHVADVPVADIALTCLADATLSPSLHVPLAARRYKAVSPRPKLSIVKLGERLVPNCRRNQAG